MPGPPPQSQRYSISCGDERSCCESSEIQAKAIDRVRDQAFHAVEERSCSLGGCDPCSQCRLQDKQWRQHRPDPNEERRKQRRRSRPLQAERRKQESGEGYPKRVVCTPAHQQLASDGRCPGYALMHPLPLGKVTDPAPQESEIQGRYSKLSKQKGPCVHHQCGANTDQNRAQHEFDCLTHGNPFGRPSASTSSVPSGAAIIKFVLPDVSPRLHYDRAGYTRSYRGSVGEVEGKGQPDDADHHNQFDDGALLERPCWLQIPSARMRSGATLVKRHAAIVVEPAKFGDCVDASLCREFAWQQTRPCGCELRTPDFQVHEGTADGRRRAHLTDR